MKISREEVDKTAELARLKISEEKLELFSGQLSSILDYMDTLNELDTSDVSPLYGPVDHHTPYRQDEVRRDYNRREVLANAPEEDGKYFIVPKVV